MLNKIATLVLILLGLFLLIYFVWDATNENNALSKIGTGISNFSNIFSSSDDENAEPTKPGKIRKLDTKDKTKTVKTEKTRKTIKTEKQPDETKPPYKLKKGTKISYSIEDDLVVVIQCERKLTPSERDKLKAEVKQYLRNYIDNLDDAGKKKLFSSLEEYQNWNMLKYFYAKLKLRNGVSYDEIIDTLEN